MYKAVRALSLTLSVAAVDVPLLALAVVAVAVGPLDDAGRAAGLVAVAVAARRRRLLDEVHGHEGRHQQEHARGLHLAWIGLGGLHTAKRSKRGMDAISSHAERATDALSLSLPRWTADALVLAKITSKRLFIQRADFVPAPPSSIPRSGVWRARAGRAGRCK